MPHSCKGEETQKLYIILVLLQLMQIDTCRKGQLARLPESLTYMYVTIVQKKSCFAFVLEWSRSEKYVIQEFGRIHRIFKVFRFG